MSKQIRNIGVFLAVCYAALFLQVNRLTIAGINFSGRVTQSRAGPWVGTLTMSGQGIDGVVHLGAEGRYQRVEIAGVVRPDELLHDRILGR